MRISDWSSDVCSSDLFIDEIDRLVRQVAIGDVAVRELGRRDQRAVGDVDLVMDLVTLLQSTQNRDCVLDAGFADQHLQIGSASCRERGCQYVEISVVAVSLKKKNKR